LSTGDELDNGFCMHCLLTTGLTHPLGFIGKTHSKPDQMLLVPCSTDDVLFYRR